MMYYRCSLSLPLTTHRPRQQPATLPPCAVAGLAAVLWIAVSLFLCFGYYGNRRVLLGANTSRLLAVSSIFVRRIQVSGAAANGGLVLYGFAAMPELRSGNNWTLAKRLSVEPYGRRGFSLWLNRGSVIKLRWTFVAGGHSAENLKVVLFRRGERSPRLLHLYPTSSKTAGFNSTGSTNGVSGAAGQAEYSIEEDDSYYVGAANEDARTVGVSFSAEISPAVYDVRAATSACSTGDGRRRCEMELRFPRTQYVVLATPAGDDSMDVWYVELSFAARLMAYFGIVGFMAAILWFLMKHLNACNEERTREGETTTTTENVNEGRETTAQGNAETDPILATKETPCTYGAMEEEHGSGSCHSSAEDLYDKKICVICYEGRRSCFFMPCGHCATCNACAKRIMEEENKACPICRRLIHKVRRLIYP